MKYLIIPQRNRSHLVQINEGKIELIKKCDIPYHSKSVIANNGMIVSIIFSRHNRHVLIHHTRNKFRARLKTDNFQAIAVKNNTVYLGGHYFKDTGETVQYADLTNNDFIFKGFRIPVKEGAGKSIDDILIFENRMILVDNIVFPKYLFEYDISIPNEPKYKGTEKLDDCGAYEHIRKGDLNASWMAIYSVTGETLDQNSGQYITITGRTSLVIDNIFPSFFETDIKPDYRFLDFALVGSFLVLLTNKGLSKIDLLKSKKGKLVQETIAVSFENAEKIIKIDEQSFIVLNENLYEIIMMSYVAPKRHPSTDGNYEL